MPELLIDIALRATVILAAALAATVALRRAAAATRHLVWALAVAGVLALPAMRAALPEWQVLRESTAARCLAALKRCAARKRCLNGR